MSNPNRSKVYLMKALQPIHIGTGGYRLERIDNKIVRDEENVPIIPGTALSGAARSFLAMETKSKCGGRSGCGNDVCLVCMTFGFAMEANPEAPEDNVSNQQDSKTKKTRARQGMVQLYDAKVLFFPVATMKGPVWITTKARMQEFVRELQITQKHKDLHQKLSIAKWPDLKENSYFCIGNHQDITDAKRLNLGWLVFEQKSCKDFTKGEDWDLTKVLTNTLTIENIIAQRLICVPDSIFALIVDENLEIRTSVAIDPATNAADEGALFTYEAVPPTTYFYSTITYNDPSGFMTGDSIFKSFEQLPRFSSDKSKATVKTFIEGLEISIAETFPYFKLFGVGGLTTRGFGRLEIREVPECEL